MKTKEAYNSWAETYDTVLNKTRDLEAFAKRKILKNVTFSSVIEIGCGTGKNTAWLSRKTKQLTAVDFSEEMLNVARKKINSKNLKFLQADITKPWKFGQASLITCSLVLEHIENIDFIFKQAAKSLKRGGHFYICELHPYKQLQGSRAKFMDNHKQVELEYFVHHISDFYSLAIKYGMTCVKLNEWFDDDHDIPRLVSFLFR